MSAAANPLVTREAMRALVCAAMEPVPAPVSARELRARERNWTWVSWHTVPSPLGWWEAQIGTDHGPPEDDDKPAVWEPARDPVEDIGDAWLVVEALRERFPFRLWTDSGRYTAAFVHDHYEGHQGATAPLAISRAALAAVEWERAQRANAGASA